MSTITIQPGQPGNGMDYDVHQPLPYPFHLDSETGDCVHGRGTDWLEADVRLGGDPWRLVGFQATADIQEVNLFLKEWAEAPERAVGLYPVFVHEGAIFSLTTPITNVRVTGGIR